MPAAQAAETLGLGEAIRQALASHPELTLNRIDSDIAATETRRIEGQLDPVVTASIGATDDKSPVASSFQPSRTVSGQLNAGISKPLANGDTVGASLAYNRARQSFSNPVAAQFALVNPAYRGQIDLNYRHPLLRGNDRPDYGDALQAAEDDVKASRLQRRTIARTLALQITNAYYQFASDHIQLRLAEQAVARAERLLNYQAFRERFGLIETSDRLQARALLEARRLDQAQAEAQLETDRTALNRLLLAAPDRPIEPAMPGNVTEQAPTDFEQLVDTASRKRPEFTILDTGRPPLKRACSRPWTPNAASSTSSPSLARARSTADLAVPPARPSVLPTTMPSCRSNSAMPWATTAPARASARPS